MRVVGRRNGSWHPACHRLLRGRIPLPHDGCNHLRQRLSMPQPKNVWWHQVLLHRHVLLTRPLVGPHKHIAQQVHAVEFVHAQHAVHIRLLRYVDERQRAQVVTDEGDVGGQARDAFIHILERLQVRQVHHQEEGLLKRVGDLGGHLRDDAEEFFEPLGQGNG